MFLLLFFQLFGYFEEKTDLWHSGLLTKLLREAHYQVESANFCIANFNMMKTKKEKIEEPHVITKWVVMDGVLSPAWVEGTNTLLDGGRKLALSNGEKVALQGRSPAAQSSLTI